VSVCVEFQITRLNNLFAFRYVNCLSSRHRLTVSLSFFIHIFCEQINYRLTEVFLLYAFANILYLTGIKGHRYASQRPPGNGKIDAARIADLVPRLNGALPISYTQFPPKRKKNACKLLFRPRRSYPSARAIIFHPTSHCLREPYIPPPNHTCKRDFSKFAPRENFRNIIFSTRALFSEL